MTDLNGDPCAGCEQLKAMLRQAENDMAELGAQLVGVQLQARRAGQAEVAIRRQLQEAMEADPKSEQIREVLNRWQARHPRAKTPTGGKRFVVVKKALKLGFTVEQLKDALDRLHEYPFVGPAGRMASGTPSQRFDDVEHALRDESTIERFIGYGENPPAAAGRTEPRLKLAQPRPRPVGPAIDRVLDKLDKVKPAGLGQWTACCPAHEDGTASLSVAHGEKGVVVRCFAGCTAQAVADAIGVPLSEWFDDDPLTVPRPRNTGVTPAPLPTEQEVLAWRSRLTAFTPMLERLQDLRGWDKQALIELDIGWDGQRLTFPVRNNVGELVNVCRYLPNGSPKMLGLRHRERDLFPRPENRAGDVWLVEGEPDAITARSLGLPGVGIPGANGWRPEWAARFAGRDVVIVPDCDEPGRRLASVVSEALYGVANGVRVVDLDRDMDQGYDLSDAVRDGATVGVLRGMAGGFGEREAA